MSERIIITDRGAGEARTRVLSISNPAERNALTAKLREELTAALYEADRDPGVRAVLLRGEGDLAFSSGGSVADLAALKTRADCDAMCRGGVELLNAVAYLSKPVVGAVRGWCVGDGFELALCCDLLYAGDDARFRMPEIDLGMTLGWGAAFRLAKRAGLIQAKEILFLGETYDAAEALALGIVNRVLPADELYPFAESVADKLAAKPVRALREMKKLLSPAILDGSYADSQVFGADQVAELMTTDDMHRAVDAFLRARAKKRS